VQLVQLGNAILALYYFTSCRHLPTSETVLLLVAAPAGMYHHLIAFFIRNHFCTLFDKQWVLLDKIKAFELKLRVLFLKDECELTSNRKSFCLKTDASSIFQQKCFTDNVP